MARANSGLRVIVSIDAQTTLSKRCMRSWLAGMKTIGPQMK